MIEGNKIWAVDSSVRFIRKLAEERIVKPLAVPDVR
jgi:hypothetical protein